MNYSKKNPQEVGRVVLDDKGKILFRGLPSGLQEQLEHGIRDWQTDTRIMPTEGDAFFAAVLRDFSGGYIRAVEEK